MNKRAKDFVRGLVVGASVLALVLMWFAPADLSAAAPAIPKTIYVAMNKDGGMDAFPFAHTTVEAAIAGDGPTTIGVYELKTTIKRRKVVQNVGEK